MYIRFTYRQDPANGKWIVTDRLGKIEPTEWNLQASAISEVRAQDDRYRRFNDDEKDLIRDLAEAKSGAWTGASSVAGALEPAFDALMTMERAAHAKRLADRYNDICFQ